MTVNSLVVVVLVALFALVATIGSREDGGWKQAAIENGGFAAFFALAEHFGFGMLPVVEFGFLPVFLAVRCPSFLRGWNYLVVAHPATPIVGPAMRGKSIDIEGLANVPVQGADDTGVEETCHYEHQAQKARALAQKLNADSAVANARRAGAPASRTCRRRAVSEGGSAPI
jgi:hypothetical protein